LGAAGSTNPEVNSRIEVTANRLVADLTRATNGSPSFNRTLASIERIGEREMRATTAITGRVSARWLGALNDVNVEELRNLAANVSSDDGLRKLLAVLDDDRSAVMAASSAIRQDQIALALQNRRLREYASLLERVEQILSHTGNLDRDAHETTSRRRQDLLEQAANASNAHAALRRMTSANDEVIRALRAAGDAALLALRSAPAVRTPLLKPIAEVEQQRRRALTEAT